MASELLWMLLPLLGGGAFQANFYVQAFEERESDAECGPMPLTATLVDMLTERLTLMAEAAAQKADFALIFDSEQERRMLSAVGANTKHPQTALSWGPSLVLAQLMADCGNVSALLNHARTPITFQSTALLPAAAKDQTCPFRQVSMSRRRASSRPSMRRRPRAPRRTATTAR